MGGSHRKKLTPEQLADFKARYDAGESVTALCLEFNVNRASGFRYINGQTKKRAASAYQNPALWGLGWYAGAL